MSRERTEAEVLRTALAELETQVLAWEADVINGRMPYRSGFSHARAILSSALNPNRAIADQAAGQEQEA